MRALTLHTCDISTPTLEGFLCTATLTDFVCSGTFPAYAPVKMR